MSIVEPSLDPEQRASIAEVGQLLEEAVLGLPDQYCTVVMLRDVEEMSYFGDGCSARCHRAECKGSSPSWTRDDA
jgi:phenylpyruvate tautomerase PptA (4-oxalocrotonate tautomerase family)